jgi:hypothetical protein
MGTTRWHLRIAAPLTCYPPSKGNDMPLRRSSIVLGVIGAVLIISALLVRFVAVPVLTRLPGSLDVTLHYTGTSSLLNAQAVQSGDSAHVFLKDVPTTIDRHFKAVSTTAHTAVVTDDMNLSVAGTTSSESHTYALDRTTLRTVPAPSGTAAEPSTGCLAVAFPLNPKPDNSYTVYDASTQQCFPVTYVGKDSRGGRSVYAYTAAVTGAIKEQRLLRTLPSALPKQTLAALAPQLPEAVRAKMIASLAQLPDPVPLAYAAQTTLNVWADRETGLPIDETLHQQVIVGVDVAGQRVDVLPVLDVSAAFTPDSINSTAKLADTASTKLLLLETVTPAVLAALGVLLLVIAVVRRRPATALQPQDIQPPAGVPTGPAS